MNARRISAYLLGVVIAGWALGSLLPSRPVAAQVGDAMAVTDTEALLASIQDAATFDVVLPPFARDGSEVENVMMGEPVGDQFGFDVFYQTSAGTGIHLWEANIRDLRDKDPTVGGRSIEIGGHKWTLIELPADGAARYSLATRLSNGVVIAFDTNADASVLIDAATNLPIR